MKKTIKLINIVAIIAIITIALTTSVFAITPDEINTNSTLQGTENLVNIGGQIVGLIRTIGTIISVGVLVVLGIKYMTASPEGKADYKGTMVPYVVGAVVLFASTWIATAVYNFASKIGQ